MSQWKGGGIHGSHRLKRRHHSKNDSVKHKLWNQIILNCHMRVVQARLITRCRNSRTSFVHLRQGLPM